MHEEDVCNKLAQRVARKYTEFQNPSGRDSPIARPTNPRRFIIAMAGGPGSGKSTIADDICKRITNTHNLSCKAVDLEGFMLPQASLDKMKDPKEARERRGAAWTFDGHAVVDFVRRCRENVDKDVQAPGFDEGARDPHPHGEIIHAGTQILIIEGIYVLSDTEPWDQIQGLADEKWFVHVRPELSRRRVAERRVSKGIAKDLDASYESYDASDGKNNDFITKNRAGVDLIIENNEEMGLHEPQE